MDDAPRTLDELTIWLQRRGADAKVFVVDGEPDRGGFYVRRGPPYWTLNHYDWQAEGTVVRCDSESELCACYVELVLGTDRYPGSMTQRVRREVRDRIEASWQKVVAESTMQWPKSDVERRRS